jgi:hypothetical protein
LPFKFHFTRSVTPNAAGKSNHFLEKGFGRRITAPDVTDSLLHQPEKSMKSG